VDIIVPPSAVSLFHSYPRIQFFRTEPVRTLMVDTLFIYAKLYPQLSYRQVSQGHHA